eukprot:968892-Prorocentrum_minimum.AAC.1
MMTGMPFVISITCHVYVIRVQVSTSGLAIAIKCGSCLGPGVDDPDVPVRSPGVDVPDVPVRCRRNVDHV